MQALAPSAGPQPQVWCQEDVAQGHNVVLTVAVGMVPLLGTVRPWMDLGLYQPPHQHLQLPVELDHQPLLQMEVEVHVYVFERFK